MNTVLDICGFCPRLCRHVCPVVVATAREAATPTAIVTAVRLAEAAVVDQAVADAALALCNGCGACTRHCALDMDVAAFARQRRPLPQTAPLPVLRFGGVRRVRVEAGSAPEGGEAAADDVVWSPDALGHASWKAGDTAVAADVARHFAGWEVRTGSSAVAEVFDAAIALGFSPPIVLVRDSPVEGLPRVLTCWEGASGGDGQIACCGAREGFETTQPAAARAMAREMVLRMGGREHACADSRCASWLREAGGTVRGPDADKPG